MVPIKNYTPIDHLLIKKQAGGPISLPKESEPLAKKNEVAPPIDRAETTPHHTIGNKTTIQFKPTTISLPPDLSKIGLRSIDSEQLPEYARINLPITDDKILPGLKAPITSSLRWLATLAIYLLKRAHLGLKIVHGHVIRIIRP